MVAQHAIDLGAMSVFLYCFRKREDEDFRNIHGRYWRMTIQLTELAASGDPPPGQDGGVAGTIFEDDAELHVDDYETLLTKNRIWIRRTKGGDQISLRRDHRYHLD